MIGTEKQVAWAEKIRDLRYLCLDEYAKQYARGSEWAAEVKAAHEDKPARYWIDLETGRASDPKPFSDQWFGAQMLTWFRARYPDEFAQSVEAKMVAVMEARNEVLGDVKKINAIRNTTDAILHQIAQDLEKLRSASSMLTSYLKDDGTIGNISLSKREIVELVAGLLRCVVDLADKYCPMIEDTRNANNATAK